MAKKVIRLTEADIEKIVDRIIGQELNEIRIKGKAREKFYLLTPQDSEYKEFVEKQATLRTGENKDKDIEEYLQYKMSRGNNKSKRDEMMELMDEESINIFNSMPASFQYYCVAFYNRKVDELRKQFITAENTLSIKEVETPGKVEEPGLKFSSLSADLKNQFEYNEAVLTNEFKSYINDVVKKAGESIKVTPNSRGVGELKSMTVIASSSTIPNLESKVTFPGKVPTFCELSEARAQAVKDYVMEAFASVNIKPSSDFQLNINTTNAPQYDNWNSGDYECTRGPIWKKGDDKKSLQKFQRADIGFTFAVRTELDPPMIEPEVDTFEVESFAVTMGGRKRRPRKTRKSFDWRGFDFRIQGGGSWTPDPILCDAYK